MYVAGYGHSTFVCTYRESHGCFFLCSCVELPQVPPFFGAELCDVDGTMVIKGRGACDTKVCPTRYYLFFYEISVWRHVPPATPRTDTVPRKVSRTDKSSTVDIFVRTFRAQALFKIQDMEWKTDTHVLLRQRSNQARPDSWLSLLCIEPYFHTPPPSLNRSGALEA